MFRADPLGNDIIPEEDNYIIDEETGELSENPVQIRLPVARTRKPSNFLLFMKGISTTPNPSSLFLFVIRCTLCH